MPSVDTELFNKAGTPLETVPPDPDGGIPDTPCWVAREVYGAGNPRWLDFRAWLLDEAPGWLRIRYIRRGESWAQWLSTHAWLKPAVRAMMESILRVRRRR